MDRLRNKRGLRIVPYFEFMMDDKVPFVVAKRKLVEQFGQRAYDTNKPRLLQILADHVPPHLKVFPKTGT